MDDGKFEMMIANEKEWRKALWKKVETMESNLSKKIKIIEDNQVKGDKMIHGLKIKVAFFGALFGVIGSKLTKLLNF